VDHPPAALGHHQRAELLGVGELAEGLEHPLLAAGLEPPAGQLDVPCWSAAMTSSTASP
jgi:hypothetical protein